MRARSLGVLLFSVPAVAAAQDEDPQRPFEYTRPQEPDVIRVLVEEAAALGLGYGEYVLTSNVQQSDWRLPRTVGTVGEKLVFLHWSYDDNNFSTNFLTHFSGAVYYTIARGNRLSIPVSFAITFASSYLWEVLGEIREFASINDQIYTSIAGLALGEPLTQLAAYFDAGPPTPTNRLLGWANPFKAFGDALDRAEPKRFTQDDWMHQLRLTVAPMATLQNGVVHPAIAVAGSAKLAHIPGFRDAGHRTYDDGNVSSLGGELTFYDQGVADARLESFAYVAGTWDRTRVGRGKRFDALTGIGMGVEVQAHRWDLARPSAPLDMRGEGQLVRATYEPTIVFGALHARFGLTAAASFAGITSWALAGRTPPEGAPSVVAKQGYYYAVGALIAPSFEVGSRALTLGASATSHVFWGAPGHVTSANDTWTTLDAWVAARPVIGAPLELAVHLRHGERYGAWESFTKSARETSLVLACSLAL